MSGHSKWSTIKRQKGVTDSKRGAAFTKLGNFIAIATREGGSGDPDSNFKLRLAIEKARQANMPKENIQRSIDRGLGKGGETVLENGVFEGFGPGGVAIIVETISDNNTRTVNELKMVFSKMGGNLGNTGSVSYLFSRQGEIQINKTNETNKASNPVTFNEIFEKAVNAGAEDIEEDEDAFLVFTHPEQLHKVKEELIKAGLNILDAGLIFRPNKETMITLSNPEQEEKVHNLLSAIDDLDDVQNVFSNLA